MNMGQAIFIGVGTITFTGVYLAFGTVQRRLDLVRYADFYGCFAEITPNQRATVIDTLDQYANSGLLHVLCNEPPYNLVEVYERSGVDPDYSHHVDYLGNTFVSINKMN